MFLSLKSYSASTKGVICTFHQQYYLSALPRKSHTILHYFKMDVLIFNDNFKLSYI
jgi:hypothetical protein